MKTKRSAKSTDKLFAYRVYSSDQSVSLAAIFPERLDEASRVENKRYTERDILRRFSRKEMPPAGCSVLPSPCTDSLCDLRPCPGTDSFRSDSPLYTGYYKPVNSG